MTQAAVNKTCEFIASHVCEEYVGRGGGGGGEERRAVKLGGCSPSCFTAKYKVKG